MRRWFGEYLDAFSACGRGEKETTALLGYYGVPLMVTTDDGFMVQTSDGQVVAMLQRQVDGMRAAGYAHTELVDSDIAVLNSRSALYRATSSRQRSDGSEIGRVTATYLVTDGPAGRRFSALLVHSR